MLPKSSSLLVPGSRWTVKKLLLTAYGIIFLATGCLYSIFGVLLIRSHVDTEQKLFVQKIEATIKLNENEFLDELALRDHAALRNHLDIIRRDLNADQVILNSPEISARSETAGVNSTNSPLWRPLDRFFQISAARYSNHLSNDFGTLTGVIEIIYSQQLFQQILKPAIDQFLLSFCFAFLAETLLFLVLFALLRSLLIQPLQKLAGMLKTEKESGMDDILLSSTSWGTKLIEISDLLNSLADYQKFRKKADVADLAALVSHDIRSALTALDALLPQLTTVPENMRVVVRRAVTRIRDIANILLSTSTGIHAGCSRPTKPENEAVMLISEIDAILSEKRVEYRNRQGITIECLGCESGYGVFVRVDPLEFSRVISNLINNSVKFMNDQGIVQVKIHSDAESVFIEVKDDGTGIDAVKLQALNSRSDTLAKDGSQGYGLSHAKENVKRWGGTLRLASTPGCGASVHIRLPRVAPPAWFLPHLDLSRLREIVILDDDPFIHGVWRNCFAENLWAEERLSLTHLHNEEELDSFINLEPVSNGRIFLMDYELMGNARNGLELIQEHRLELQSVLVTSRWQEFEIRKKCLDLGIKLLPKGMAILVPLIEPGPNISGEPSCVLIDDETITADTWNILGEPLGKFAASFQTPQEFLAVEATFRRDIPVYVDSKLSNEVRGEIFAKDLWELGFRNIILSTAHPAEHFSDMPWLSDIRGKECPWVLEGST